MIYVTLYNNYFYNNMLWLYDSTKKCIYKIVQLKTTIL